MTSGAEPSVEIEVNMLSFAMSMGGNLLLIL